MNYILKLHTLKIDPCDSIFLILCQYVSIMDFHKPSATVDPPQAWYTLRPKSIRTVTSDPIIQNLKKY